MSRAKTLWWMEAGQRGDIHHNGSHLISFKEHVTLSIHIPLNGTQR
jgi:hypothetical protein